MNKKILVGLSSVVLAAAVGGGVYAATSVTDILSITVSDAASLTSSHSAGSSTGAGTWSGNTLSSSMSVNSVGYNLGSTTLTIRANYPSGYKVTVATGDLTNSSASSYKIAYDTAYATNYNKATSPTSGWAIANGSTSTATKYSNGGTIKSEQSVQVNTTTATVYYGAGITATQPAGTYTNNSAAVYTLAAY